MWISFLKKNWSHTPSAPRALVPQVARVIRDSCSMCSCAVRASSPMHPCVPRIWCLECSCVSRASCYALSRASCALFPKCPRALLALFPYVYLLPHTLCILCANITICALALSCVTILFFCSFPTCELLCKFTKVGASIDCH